MPPKGGITARVERLELVYSDLDDRLDLVLQRINDICPTNSRKILDAMQKMEKIPLAISRGSKETLAKSQQMYVTLCLKNQTLA